MIVKPAIFSGLTISDTLARRIVNDTLAFRNLDSSDSDTANLPLLAFVLDHLFEKRSDRGLSGEVYTSIGGISGAVAEHVKTVEKELRQFEGAKTSDHLAKIFSALVNVKNEESPPTRKRPLLVDFPLDLRQSIKILVDARLLRTEGEGERSSISISHEKLFEASPALREYIGANKKALIDQTLLESRARKWADMGKPWINGLASGPELKDFQRTGVPTPLAKKYVSASRRAVWLRKGTGGFLLLVLFVIMWAAWRQGLSVKQTLPQFKSIVMGIYIEPEMIEVKGGVFKMGDVVSRGDDDKRPRPARDVQVKTFAIGKYEITFEEYDRFALAKRRQPPYDQGWGRGVSQRSTSHGKMRGILLNGFQRRPEENIACLLKPSGSMRREAGATTKYGPVRLLRPSWMILRGLTRIAVAERKQLELQNKRTV